ncbi:MAG: hypothetical protein FWG37_06585 [Clostridia bacterium]|nr:hypothetical protein [Clostridia bacterium]
MTGKQRTTNILRRLPVDRIGLFEHFWNDTHKAWCEQGHLQPGQSMEDAFGFDMQVNWSFNLMARFTEESRIVAEDEDTVTLLDGNGATLRRHKKHDTTPEHVDFIVKDRHGWETTIKPYLTPDPRRINFSGYREAKRAAEEAGRFFFWAGVNAFESIHPVCGHEHMLVGMVEDPEWVAEMAETFAALTIEMQRMLFEREGPPDGVWYYEDMGYKGSPFMSPSMYRDLIKPAHAKTMAYAHGLDLPVVMHSCGFIEPLLPDMIDAGIDCLQVIEIKAGMDLLRLHRLYGEQIALMGGIDVRSLYSNDRAVIDRELEAKIPTVKNGFGYVLHSDHSIPATVDFDTYAFFVEKGLELGAY